MIKRKIVFSVGCFCHSGDNEVLENPDRGILIKTKELLNDMHKGKIDMDDEIFITNVEGYIESNSKPERLLDTIERIDKCLMRIESLNL